MRRVIASRALTELRLIAWQGKPAIERYTVVQEMLAVRCGSPAASLFAEPILHRSNGVTSARVDWCVSSDAPPMRWSELDADGQARLKTRFAAVLATVRPLLYDPHLGPLLAACLNLASRDSLALLGGEPLLLDWGMLPSKVRDSAASAAHNQSILGEFDGLRPAFDAEDWAARYGVSPSGTSSFATPATANNAAGGPSWRAPATACGIAAAALLLSFAPGVLAFQGAPALGSDPAVQDGLMAGLRGRLDRLGWAMGLDCVTLKSQSPPLLPADPASLRPVAPASEPNPRAAAQPREVSPIAADPSSLVARLERGVVLVVAGDKLGSGFFVSPELIVTNRHVAGGGGEILIAGKQVGVIPATLAAVGDADPLKDFALLRVKAQSKAEPFTLASPTRSMEPVVSAGFPGLYMTTDPSFQRLKQGDETAAADLAPVFQAGVVNHLQRYARDGVTLVVHSAEIAPGNSGGPLVDACGRVLGVNTFDRSASDRAAVRARYALGSDGLSAFLASAGLDLRPEQGVCAPAAALVRSTGGGQPGTESGPATAAPPIAPTTRAPGP